VRNKIIIIVSKTKEIVFRRPNPRVELVIPALIAIGHASIYIVMPALIAIDTIKDTNLLAVIFSEYFHFDSSTIY
jgi:hypothetical protein